MKLATTEVLFVDCQTTGIRPPSANILELGWLQTSAASLNVVPAHSSLIRLPAETVISPVVRQITGLTDEDLLLARPESEVFSEFHAAAMLLKEPRVAIIHYAQFEKPFLADLYARHAGGSALPFQILCAQQLCKRLLPNLPSQNIRAAAGFFGEAPSHTQRAGAHVSSTARIWCGLVELLKANGIEDFSALENWLRLAPPRKPTRYEYRLDKLKRLELPDAPGIYRMLAQSGTVLYVGKATSLKSRVNSYFRGQKNRDRFKLEMLAQVWDLRVTECNTALEAALLESDEVKRLNPPYNIALKRGLRHLLFYDHSFSNQDLTPSTTHPVGPFRNSNWIEPLRLVYQSLSSFEFLQIFFNPIAPETLRSGFNLFCSQRGLDLSRVRSPRSLLAFAMWLHKHHVESEETRQEDAAEEVEAKPEAEPTPEEVAEKFARLFLRAAAEYRRSKVLTQLLDADIDLNTQAGSRRLSFRAGQLTSVSASVLRRPHPWQGLQIDDFDRMSILLSELSKYEHSVLQSTVRERQP